MEFNLSPREIVEALTESCPNRKERYSYECACGKCIGAKVLNYEGKELAALIGKELGIAPHQETA